MKRLQFRHNNTIWKNREEALQYFKDITTSESDSIIVKERSEKFGDSLFAEPMVTKYLDADGKQQIIFAIGVDNGKVEYHIIDSKEIAEKLYANKEAIKLETERAIAAEQSLSGSIETEIARAMNAELFLSGAIRTEREERVAADTVLQTQIDTNIAKIHSVKPSSANVLEEYALKNANGIELGEHIKIYKDSSLVTSQIGYAGVTGVTKTEDNIYKLEYDIELYDNSNEYLYLIYRDENGNLQFVAIDFEEFLMESEYGEGLKLVDHVLHINIKDGEKYLSVSNDGLQTINIDNAIEEAIKTSVENLNKEIDRLSAVDNYISGVTTEFSAATVSEFINVKSGITVEAERSMAAELALSGAVETETARALEAERFLSGAVETETARALEEERFLSGAVNTEREERISEDNAIKSDIISNQISSKDLVVDKQASGTTITIQTDEVTITKYADAQSIYDTEVSILGTCLKIKKVEPTNNAVKTRYELQGKDGKMIGEPIEMMVESALIGVKQGKVGDTINTATGKYETYGDGDTTMNFVYRLEDGKYELVQIVVSQYFTDSHFGKGLNNQDGVITLKEGDGNEYLVIGEDTVSVVGVDNAILVAKNEVKGYADQKSLESNSYTDTRISDVTTSIETAISSMNTTLNTAVEEINNTINSRIDDVNETLNTEITNRENSIIETHTRINTLDEKIDSLISGVSKTIDTNVSALTTTLNNEVNNLTKLIKNSDDEVFASAKTFTELNKVSDVIYDKNEKIIYLQYADNQRSIGFDAKQFLVDGILENVTFDEATDSLTFIWNASAEKKDITISLSKFIDIYLPAEDSVDFIDITNYKISAIVDKQRGSTNTLATTNFVEQHGETIITKVNESLDKLNGGKDVVGSILYLIDKEVESSFITDGLPATTVTPEEANKIHSLLRSVSVNGETKYYVSNNISDMFIHINGVEIKLENYLTGMEQQIKTLENKITELEELVNKGVNADDVKEIIKSYLQGTNNEIAITENEETKKLLIGFADNAIFGEE